MHALVRGRGEVVCGDDVARFCCDTSQPIEGEHLDMGCVVAPGVVEDRCESVAGAGYLLSSVECCK